MWGLTVRKNDYYRFINWLFIYHALDEHGEYLLTEVYHSIASGINLSYIVLLQWHEGTFLLFAGHVSQGVLCERNTIRFILEEDEKRKIRNTGINFAKMSVCAARKRHVHVLAKDKGGDEIYGIFNLQGWHPSL